MTYAPRDLEQEEYEEGLSDLETEQIYTDGSYSSPFSAEIEEEFGDDDDDFDLGPELDLPSFGSASPQKKLGSKKESDHRAMDFIDRHRVAVFRIKLLSGEDISVAAVKGNQEVAKDLCSLPLLPRRRTPHGKSSASVNIVLDDQSYANGKDALDRIVNAIEQGSVLELGEYAKSASNEVFRSPLLINSSAITCVRAEQLDC